VSFPKSIGLSRFTGSKVNELLNFVISVSVVVFSSITELDFLTDPQDVKTKSKIKVELTSRELHMLYDWYDSADEELHLANSKNQLTDKQLTQHIELYDKLRAAKMDFFIGYNKRKII